MGERITRGKTKFHIITSLSCCPSPNWKSKSIRKKNNIAWKGYKFNLLIARQGVQYSPLLVFRKGNIHPFPSFGTHNLSEHENSFVSIVFFSLGKFNNIV
jgi:hypothetical protein